MKNVMKHMLLLLICLAGLATCKKETTEIPQKGIYKGEFLGYYLDDNQNKVELDNTDYYYVKEVTDSHIIIGGDTIVKNGLSIEGHLLAYTYTIKEGRRYRFRKATLSGELVKLGDEYQIQGTFSCNVWFDYLDSLNQYTELQEYTTIGTFKFYPVDSFMQELN